ncbi:MAG: phosphate-starvation-inducible PsiE family protein [Desulfitobacteriaceae bacterium]
MVERIIKQTSRLVVWTEVMLHLVVFVMLIAAAALLIVDAVHNFGNTHAAILLLLSNALLLLIIKEIIWTVFRFFKKEKFSLSPFLYIGVISGVREILFLSIEKSIEKGDALIFSLEILANATVVFLLVAAYYLFKKARVTAGEDS